MKVSPIRTCIVCKNKGDKSLFLKVVLSKNGDVMIETNKKLDGRGAYICKNSECALKCQKTKALNRVFKKEIAQNVYEDIVNATK